MRCIVFLEEIYVLFGFLSENTQPLPEDAETVTENQIVLPPLVTDEIRSGLEEGGSAFVREIERCFGIDRVAALVRRGHRGAARIVLRRCSADESAGLEHAWRLTARESEFKTTIPREFPIPALSTDIDRMREYAIQIKDREQDGFSYAALHARNILSDLIRPHIFGPAHLPAYYLPADRTGVMHAHSVVVSALIGSAPTAGLRPAARTPMLSGVLADFLEQLIEVDRPMVSPRRRARDLGARIEEAVLGGTVRVDRSAVVDYPRFAYRPGGWKGDLPLMNASSMVSELAPVVLYLRHMVEPGNVLIIEEPESHLHPAKQVEFTRQLTALVDAGIRVIVTTHSEWLLEEVANIVRRSELPRAERRRGDVALRRDQVGAWLFQPKKRPRGSAVTEIHLDDTGSYASGFEEVATALHNDWAEISSRIGDGS